MKQSFRIGIAMGFLACSLAASPAQPVLADSTESPPLPTLQQAFADAFLVGAALSREQILGEDPETLDLVLREFNALTAENINKWEEIQPVENQFDWDAADALVTLATEHGMHLTGHVLIWHQQTPDWVFQDAAGNPASRELLLQRMENHINTVVGRYKGRIDSWEVVNEALNEDGSLRETPWLNIIGPDFIQKAFEFARAADPDAALYYNDYNMYQPEKRAGAVRVVRELQAAGVRVDGIGMQGHYGLNHPEDMAMVADSIQAFSELGAQVYITELDLAVLPFPDEQSRGADLSVNHELNASLNPYADGLPEAVERAQADRYLALFRVLLENRDKISRVTFWGVNDAQSWKNNWPMRGRTDYPLLFDRNNQRKLGYFEIIKLAADMLSTET